MGKKTVFTNITPLPPQVSREVAIAMLHNHDEMIELNPLVVEHHPIAAPRNASKDEFLDCAWQEMTDKIHYLPGGIVKGKVSYKGCFHDLPNGLQTHIYAPMNLDIREKWTVCGTLPGEPEEPQELGLNAPRTGLYLREDGEMKCNALMTGFVRKNLDASHRVLVERILAKAERVQAHLDSALPTPAASIREGMPSFQRGSHMSSSSIVQQMSRAQRESSQRSVPLRSSSDSVAIQSVHGLSRQELVPELPTATPNDSPLQNEGTEIDEAELHTVHPALREQYRQSRSIGSSRVDTVLPEYHTLDNPRGQFYQSDVAKRPVGKQFAVELEGSIPFIPQGSSRTSPPTPLSAEAKREGIESAGPEPRRLRPANTYPGVYHVPEHSSDGDEYEHSLNQRRIQTQPPEQGESQQLGIASEHKIDRHSVVSNVSDLSTPRTQQTGFVDHVDDRFSVVSAITEEPSTPRFPQHQPHIVQQRQSRRDMQQDNFF